MARRNGITAQLNATHGPGWRAVRDGFGWRWTNGVRTVRAYSEARLGWDGYDDDNFLTAYIDDDGHKLGCQGVIFSGWPLGPAAATTKGE